MLVKGDVVENLPLLQLPLPPLSGFRLRLLNWELVALKLAVLLWRFLLFQAALKAIVNSRWKLKKEFEALQVLGQHCQDLPIVRVLDFGFVPQLESSLHYQRILTLMLNMRDGNLS